MGNLPKEAKLRIVTSSDIAPIEELCKEGLYLQAYRAASKLGPLAEWSGGAARVMAGRLARELGAPRLAQWHHLLAWREEPDLPEVRFYYVTTIGQRRGPYAAWRLLKKCGELTGASPRIRSDWYALHANLAATLRDFDTADAWLARAEAIAPENAWVHVSRSGVLQLGDRYQESLEAALHALSLRPWYRVAVWAVAQAQVHLGRDEEALAILTEADTHLESSLIVSEQIGLLLELQRYKEAKNQVERLVELTPLMEAELTRAIAGLRSDVSYFLNEFEAAIDYGRQNDGPFFKEVAAHLEEPARKAAPRVVLPVEFVRQHYQTCVPATLTVIGRFWSKPAEHLQIAEQICYDGTTAYSERTWAALNGWLAREFTVTEESTTALINQGVPFTLSIVAPGSAHMQAVIGYDGRRGTMLVRDPYVRYTGEILIDRFLQEYAATGPRGMALVPLAERERLDRLELPDQELWDQLHQFDGALERHRWPEAEQIYRDLVASNPTHGLTLRARWRLAAYDANTVAMLAAVEALLERYPEDETLNLARLSSLSELGRRDELLAAYKELCARKDAHPIFTQQYAQALAVETGERERATRLLHRAIRQWPTEAGSYFILANLYWQQQKHEDALELYRFAICLKDKEEDFARAYFSAAQFLGQADGTLEFLSQRWRRFKSGSSMTARTLAWAHGQLERWQEAINVLDETLAEHPEDGELMLDAASLLAQASSDYYDRADELLASGKPKAPRRQWLRTAANLMAVRMRPTSSLALWQELLEIQPLAIGAHRAIAHLLLTTQNQEAALAHLQAYAARFPHYYPIHDLLADWYQDLGLKEAFWDASRKLVALAPQNDHGLALLGEALLWNDQHQAAYNTFQAALELNPANGFTGEMLFDLQLQWGNLAAAAETLTLLERHGDAVFVTAKSIQLALRQDDKERVMSGLERLCVMPDKQGWALSTAISDMASFGLSKEVFAILDEAIKQPDAIVQVGEYWMQGCLSFGKQGYWSRLEALSAVGAAGERATEIYLMHLARHGGLYRFIERNYVWLGKHARTCGQVAYLLQQAGDKEVALGWAQAVRHLPGRQPWMLIALVELLWDAGKMDEVVKVNEQALLLPADSWTPVHRIWLAAEAAFSGDAERALGQMAFVRPTGLKSPSRVLYQMTRAVARSVLAPESQRQQLFRELHGQVADAVEEIGELSEVNDTHRRFCRQSVKRISREIGGFQAWLWRYWMLFRLR